MLLLSYILLYLLDVLPWKQQKSSDVSSILKIIELKQNILTNEYLPEVIKEMLVYIKKLQFEETPDYKLLIKLLENNNIIE